MEVLLRSNSLEAREAMKTNTFLKEGKKYVLLLRNVIMKDDQEFIKWEAIEEEKFQKPSFMKSFFISLRAISLTAVFTPCLAIYLFGQYSGYTANSTFNWLSTIGVIFALLAVNVFNDVSDHYKLIDLPENVGGSGVIQKGWISARQLRTIGIVFLTIGFAIGTYLLSQVNGIEIFILLGFVGAIGYSASTWGLKYHALGDLAVLLFCGPVLTIGHSLVTFGEVIPGVLPLVYSLDSWPMEFFTQIISKIFMWTREEK
jgi:1,4-dihydroxy-2-naphthoate octaprenyltransferase